MPPVRRYYQILGVAPTASPEEIKEAWLFSLKAFHPDKFASSSTKQRAVAEARTSAINEAYRILSDPISRSVYDRDYFRETSQQKPQEPARSAIPPLPAANSTKRNSVSASARGILSFVRQRPVTTIALVGGVVLVSAIILIVSIPAAKQPEPPFTRIVVPSLVPTPSIAPVVVEKTPGPQPAIAFDLPKLAAVTRKAVGLVIGYDDKGKIIQTGSGFFISEDGRFVTNEHVIHGTNRVSIKMENDAFYGVAKTLADSTKCDLAILQVRAKEMPYLTLETSGIPDVGTRIAVIGSPQALEGTLSDGIVSAVRATEGNGTWIQITAPISPGSSGSPVLNAQGRVVGVVALGSNGRIQNLNFARSTFDLVLLSQSINSSPRSTPPISVALRLTSHDFRPRPPRQSSLQLLRRRRPRRRL